MTNSRFTVAVHILCLLAHTGRKQFVTSEYIASSVNTNPVVIRRILASLREAGLVASNSGPTGGWLLNKPAEQIELVDVLEVLGKEPTFSLHPNLPNQRCVVGKNVQEILKPIFAKADKALLNALEGISIADLLKRTLKNK